MAARNALTDLVQQLSARQRFLVERAGVQVELTMDWTSDPDESERAARQARRAAWLAARGKRD